MTGQRRDETSAAKRQESHVIQIPTPLFASGYVATCSCGWRSEEMAEKRGAERASIRHLEMAR